MNLSKILFTSTAIILIAFSTISCHSTGPNKKRGQTRDSSALEIPNKSALEYITDTSWNNNSFTVYADSKLDNKYHTVYLHIKDKSGNALNDQSLDFYPEMHMGKMKHGGPYEHPVALGEGWYKGNMVFIMADIPNMGKGWNLNTILERGGKKDTVAIKIPVSAAPIMRTMSSGTRDDSRVFISCLLPDTIKQGKHPIQFLMNKMEHHHFPVLDGYLIKFKTNMPSMGHGSSGNKDGESVGEGYYEGEVNLTMPGQWEIIVELWKDGKKANQDDIKYLVNVK